MLVMLHRSARLMEMAFAIERRKKIANSVMESVNVALMDWIWSAIIQLTGVGVLVRVCSAVSTM